MLRGVARIEASSSLQPRPRRLRADEGASSSLRSAGIGERKFVGLRLDEEVERIDHLHVGEEIDGDGELGGLLREHETRQPVALRVLLPVHEMLRRRDLERIARNAGAAVRRRPQPDDLRPERDRPVVV